MTLQHSGKKPSSQRNFWLERLVAIIVLINLALVVFNLSYIPNRIFYWRISPQLTQLYDPIKAIAPHPQTQSYIDTVDALAVAHREDLPVEEELEQLRRLSIQIVDENPFARANGSSILEKVKILMRDRVGVDSAKAAFINFWSEPYLAQAGWQSELNFFNTEIRHLLETNYYREVDQFGRFVDRFWLVDLPFVIIFGLDFLIRTLAIARRNPQLNWLESMLRRWYDLFLFLPLWRWLRVIPASIRLYQTRLLNLEPVRAQINYDVVINFAEDITQVVGVQAIDQLQQAIKSGEVAHWLFHPDAHSSYQTVNDVDEVKAIAARLVKVSVYDVLPQVQPDLEALLDYSLKNSIKQLPASQQLQKLPGLGHLPTQIAQNLSQELSHLAYENITQALEDPAVAELTSRLITHFRDALEIELQKKANLQELESLLVDMLEEIKINYVKGISAGGVEKIKEEADRLHKLGHRAQGLGVTEIRNSEFGIRN